MALFYSDKAVKKSVKSTACLVDILSLDYQGLGVAKLNGKTWFVKNALPNERVEMQVLEEKRQYGYGQAVNILQQSAQRQVPQCAIYSKCGGCQMQHIALATQRATKQQALFDRLQRLQPQPIDFQPMIVGADKGYRRRVRLSMAWQKNQFVMGFRQAASQHIVEVKACEVLVPRLAALLPPLQQLFRQWQNPKRLGHIELVQADNTTAMLLRHLGKLSEQDYQRLSEFCQNNQPLTLYLMCDEHHIEHCLGDAPFYRLGDLELAFSIRDFIQVNAELNQQMVKTALDWLNVNAEDHVLDLFCGMGNFTLPLAQRAKRVVGIEGVQPMVDQASLNAKRNGIENVAFYQADLDKPFENQAWATETFNKILLDPARGGALFALDHLCRLQASEILYISCNPATLVRDAEKLITLGYQLEKSAMIDMFPHTGHLESISLFKRKNKKG